MIEVRAKDSFPICCLETTFPGDAWWLAGILMTQASWQSPWCWLICYPERKRGSWTVNHEFCLSVVARGQRQDTQCRVTTRIKNFNNAPLPTSTHNKRTSGIHTRINVSARSSLLQGIGEALLNDNFLWDASAFSSECSETILSLQSKESKVSGDGKGGRTDIGKGHCLGFHSGFGFESKNNGQPSWNGNEETKQ